METRTFVANNHNYIAEIHREWDVALIRDMDDDFRAVAAVEEISDLSLDGLLDKLYCEMTRYAE